MLTDFGSPRDLNRLDCLERYPVGSQRVYKLYALRSAAKRARFSASSNHFSNILRIFHPDRPAAEFDIDSLQSLWTGYRPQVNIPRTADGLRCSLSCTTNL